MSGIIRIDMPKGVSDGQTSLTPTSPTVSGTTSPTISNKSKVLIGYGLMTARQTITTVTQEIRAGGNEELATNIENGVTLLTKGAIAYGTGGLSLIPEAIGATAQFISRERATQRTNRAREYERSMRGSRINYNAGGGYE